MENKLEIQSDANDLTQIIGNIHAGIFLVQDGIIKYVNRRGTEIFGYTSQEITSWKLYDFDNLVHPNQRIQLREKVKDIFKRGLESEVHFEFKGIRKNNETIYLDCYSKRIQYAGRAADLFTLIDITHRKKSEENLKQSKKKFQNLVKNANSIILKLDMYGRIVFINDFGRKFFGFDKFELIGKNAYNTILPPSAKTKRDFNQMLNNIYSNPEKYKNITNENITKSGKRVWISWTNKAIKDKDGNLIGIESVGNDITKRKRARELLKDETRKLEIINQIIIAGNKATNIDSLLSSILNCVLDLVCFEAGAIYLTNFTTKSAEIKHHKNLSEDIIEKYNTLPINKDPYKIVFLDGKPLYIQEFDQNHDEGLSESSMATVPIFDNHQIIGALSIITSHSLTLTKKEKRILESVGHEIGTIITKIKAENLVTQSENNLQNLFNSLEDFIFVLDEDGEILKVNQIVLDRLGYTEDKITSMNVLDLHPRELQERTKRQFEKIISNKADFCDFPLQTKEGKLIQVNTNITKGQWGSQEVIFGICRDMEEREKWEQKLIESEQKFRTIAETSFMGIMIIEDQTVKYHNEALSRILEISHDKTIRTKHDFSNFIHPEDKKEWESKLNNINAKNQKFNSIFRIRTESTNSKWIEVFYKKVYYKKSYVEYMTVMDISKRKKAEKLIIEEYNRLMELNELRKDIITRISHELKTPLTTMYGSSQLLLETYKDQMSADVREYVEMNHRGCVRLTKLIQNLIDATILDSNKMNLNLREEDLVSIIQDSLENIKEMAKSRNLLINVHFPTEFRYSLDRERIEQAITNILSNAVKNTLPNGTITVKLERKDSYIDISVKDTGIGLTEREKEKIFKKFGKIERYKMDVDLNIEGSGLGLYISKEIIELHGGEIIAESEGRNKGAIFILRLPLYD
jgi:PAS domain S-box-containing protein